MQRLQYDVGGGEEPAVALRMERVLTRLRKCMQSATALCWLSAFISANRNWHQECTFTWGYGPIETSREENPHDRKTAL
jgi:hypothetical protein